MDYVVIDIIDSGDDKYLLKPSTTILGRLFDNESTTIKINKPIEEADSTCFMIVTNNEKVIDHIEMKDNIALIKQHISKYSLVNIGFYFTKPDNYIKSTSIERFKFLNALDPSSTIDVTPEQQINIDLLGSKAFVDIESILTDKITLRLKNLVGDVVKEIELPIGSGGGGGIAEETDPTVPKFVKDITESNIASWNAKLDKISATANNDRVYIVKSDGTQGTMVVTNGLDANAIVRRGNGGQFASPEPTNDLHVANKGYVDRKVADLVDSAPETLDTLGEVAQAIKDNEDVVRALNSAIGERLKKDAITLTLKDNGAYTLTINKG